MALRVSLPGGHGQGISLDDLPHHGGEGRETEFQCLDVMATPEQGKTLIWPAGFTHTHRGRPAPDEVKFIITGSFWTIRMPAATFSVRDAAISWLSSNRQKID